MNAAVMELRARVGATFTLAVQPHQGGDPVDLTGKTIRTALAYSDDEYADAAATPLAVDQTEGDGVAIISLPATHSNPPGRYAYRIDLLDGADVAPLMRGDFIIEEA